VAGRLALEYPALLPEIEGITRLVSNAVESTRSLARGLSPVNLERGGLQDALDGLAMHAAELYGVKVVCTHGVRPSSPLSAETANHLYRIAQEAVTNAVRHGQAQIIRLNLTSMRGQVRLVISDDGSGIPESAIDAPGMGLKIMRYRARMVGGEVRFEAGKPRGTRVVIECPAQSSPPGTKVRKARAGKPRKRGVSERAKTGDAS
jgi:signal transduction histidine kinase